MNNKFQKQKESYPENKTICDKTLDASDIHALLDQYRRLSDFRFQKCVFKIEVVDLMEIVNCYFESCIFQAPNVSTFNMSKFDIKDCIFFRSDFEKGYYYEIDISSSWFSECRFFGVTCIFTWFYDSFFQSCSCDLATLQNTGNKETTAVFRCKLWKSKSWVDIPDSDEGFEFFELHEIIDE
uniref:Pentapeptide repeat-containing protein n=1 Tax=Pseudo-nitzschia sp. TaxID=1804765 RepID=A0A8T9D1B7_9STRA|nr:hypothetical protein LKZ67_pgp129 [Pseudo-nitzschia simulans]YP_010208568.1 hypothetical protein LKZ67_pgp070 [Pseudo-nitzschia simulans]UBA15802.1 hypothetical protein [Pseudo-nitzschia sp.]UBA15861.1 hypothetical protein [Pseudo-nitzschia sp.]